MQSQRKRADIQQEVQEATTSKQGKEHSLRGQLGVEKQKVVKCMGLAPTCMRWNLGSVTYRLRTSDLTSLCYSPLLGLIAVPSLFLRRLNEFVHVERPAFKNLVRSFIGMADTPTSLFDSYVLRVYTCLVLRIQWRTKTNRPLKKEWIHQMYYSSGRHWQWGRLCKSRARAYGNSLCFPFSSPVNLKLLWKSTVYLKS